MELLDGRRVPLRIIVNPRARRISLRFDAVTREAVVVTPSQRHAARAAAFAVSRAGWLAAQIAKTPNVIALTPGASVPLRGELHELMRVDGRKAPQIEPGRIVIGAPDDAAFDLRARRFLYREALQDLTAAADRHAATLAVRYTRLTVKDTTSRWGSCSSTGALAFSWRVVLAPPFVLDYLAAHECAHLREMNHSPRFWAEVARCIPDYGVAETWLKRHGRALHAIAPKPR